MSPDRATTTPHPVVAVEATIRNAWASLPAPDRQLLDAIGASQYCVVIEPIGDAVDGMRRSAGLSGLSSHAKRRLARAYGVWIKELKIVLINAAHPELIGLSDEALEAFVAHLAWHEWGHALSVERCTSDDVFDGRRLLELCPEGLREDIRAAGYGPRSLTHEIVAEVYALLMERRQRAERGQPPWLNSEIYALVQRVTAWTG